MDRQNLRWIAWTLVLCLCHISLAKTPIQKKDTKNANNKAKIIRIQRLIDWVSLPFSDVGIKKKTENKPDSESKEEQDKLSNLLKQSAEKPVDIKLNKEEKKPKVSEKTSMGDRLRDLSKSDDVPIPYSDMSYEPPGGTPPGGMRIDFDDNAKKGGKPKSVSAQKKMPPPKKRDHKTPPSVVKGVGGGNAQQFDKFWPMCVFIDESVDDANKMIKEAVKQAAKCQVNLVVYPHYIRNYPKDPDELKDAARDKCNAVEGLGEYGVSGATATVLLGSSSIPKKMCNASGVSSKDIRYCAEFNEDPGPGMRQRLLNQGKWGGVAPSGGAAVAVIGPAGQNPKDFVGASFGQPQLGLPPGQGAGNGYGLKDEGYASAGAGAEKGWTDKACKIMRKKSFDNKIGMKTNLSQDLFIEKGNEGRYIDLRSDRTVFAKRGQGKASMNLPQGGGGKKGSLKNQKVINAPKSNKTGGGMSSAMSSDFFDGMRSQVKRETSDGGGHKKKKSSLRNSSLAVDGIYGSSSGSPAGGQLSPETIASGETAKVEEKVDLPENISGNESNKRLGFDNTASKSMPSVFGDGGVLADDGVFSVENMPNGITKKPVKSSVQTPASFMEDSFFAKTDKKSDKKKQSTGIRKKGQNYKDRLTVSNPQEPGVVSTRNRRR